MTILQRLIGTVVLSLTPVLPVAAETLISDSGMTEIYDYQYSHLPGDVLSYTTEVNGRVYEGAITVTSVGNGWIRGWFTDRDRAGNFGCRGDVSIQRVRGNRYISIWRIRGTYTPRLRCPQGGTTSRLNMRLYR